MLKDVIVIVNDISITDGGDKYPISRVYRFDYDFVEHVELPDIISHMMTHPGIMEGGQMKNE